jgi:ATPase subunit of ABC transporter with duplicated ATPase domains
MSDGTQENRTRRQRLLLNVYTEAARNIELTQVAIVVLEGVNTIAAQTAIRTLKGGQRKQLKLMDAAAAKLGAPYPGSGQS